jgi:hypothetical protein
MKRDKKEKKSFPWTNFWQFVNAVSALISAAVSVWQILKG